MARAIDDDAVKRRIWNIVEKWKYQGRKYDALLLESVIAQIVDTQPTLTPPNEPLYPHPDGDTSILACPCCGSGEYLHNEDGNEQNYCGQCGQAIDWCRPPEGEADAWTGR